MATTPEIQNVISVLQQDIENLNHDKMMRIEDIQHENTSLSKAQSRLETQVYAQEQDISKLRKEAQQLTKAKRDSEKKLAAELEEFENDRARWQQREADLYNQVRALSVSHGEPRTPRTPRRRSIQDQESTNGLTVSTPKLATIDVSYAREAKIAQRTIKAQDKLIAELKSEIEKLNTSLEEQRNDAKEQSLRMQHLEHEIANVKQVNRSLMEDNESYQILLHEKTISGEFMMNPIMQVTTSGFACLCTSTNGLNLAAEINLASVELTEENKMLQDTNRALQLYMNKILMKIISNKSLEDVLSIDQPKPTPPPATSKLAKQAKEKNITIATPQPAPGPPPSRTLSSTLLGKATTGRRERRRTISYWSGSKTPPPPTPPTPSATATPNASSTQKNGNSPPTPATTPTPGLTVDESERNGRRANGSQTNGGWAKALRRMSGIGWSSSSSSKAQGEEADVSNSSDTSSNEPAVHNNKTLESPQLTAPSMSRSTSTTSSSLRRSNELATLEEE
ncbi:hypothetical protein BX666DRAFT_2018369 [Dichotomocladium elegans]|nr:hypothetical protein BX666DRAFT_2018369 [Dichotomocladium elegans]